MLLTVSFTIFVVLFWKFPEYRFDFLLIEKISEFKDTIEHKDNIIDMFKKNEKNFINKIEALESIITELEERIAKNKKGMFNL